MECSKTYEAKEIDKHVVGPGGVECNDRHGSAGVKRLDLRAVKRKQRVARDGPFVGEQSISTKSEVRHSVQCVKRLKRTQR